MSQVIIEDAAWKAIMEDKRLAPARRKLSFHEIRMIVDHTRAAMIASQPAIPPEGQVMEAMPVAWRWRYRREGEPWHVRGTEIEPCDPSPFDVGIEVEPLFLAVTNTVEPEGSITLDNASVQRLLDYGVLHHGKDGWFVEKPSVEPDEDAEWLRGLAKIRKPLLSDEHCDRLERIASRLRNDDGLQKLVAPIRNELLRQHNGVDFDREKRCKALLERIDAALSAQDSDCHE